MGHKLQQIATLSPQQEAALAALLSGRTVTEARVAEVFRDRAPNTVRRHGLPRLHAMNFVLEGVLDGGVNDALGLDTHGKTLAFLLLGLEVEVPADLASDR
jgi:hypothetical protein